MVFATIMSLAQFYSNTKYTNCEKGFVMKIKDILESTDGPKQGMNILKTMNRDTFDLLKDLNQWNKEREQVKRDKLNALQRKINARKRMKNIFIWVGNWPVDVQVLEEWLESKNDNIPLNYSITHGWGLPRKNNPTYKLILDDPEYKTIILDIWKSAANKYRGIENVKGGPLSSSALSDRITMLGRKHRISLHVDKTGKKLSPYIRHPEQGLPNVWTQHSDVRQKID